MNQLPEALIPVDREKLRRLLRVVDACEWAGGDWGDDTMMFCPTCEQPYKLTRHGRTAGPHAADCALDNVRREWEGFRR